MLGSIAGAIDLVEDGRARVAGPQEVGVERVGAALVDGAAGGHQRLPQHLATEHALRPLLGAAAAEDVHLELFEVEERDQGVQRLRHGDSPALASA